jgi:hypothetical protein
MSLMINGGKMAERKKVTSYHFENVQNYLKSPHVLRVEYRMIDNITYKIVYSVSGNIILKIPVEVEI